METIKVGLVGAGFAANFHYECLQRIYGVNCIVAGVVSRTVQSRDKFCKAHGLEPFDTLDELIDAVDAVDIVSPPYAHAEAVIKAAKAGKTVFCEKPFTGYFGPEGVDENWKGNEFDKEKMLAEVVKNLSELAEVVRRNDVVFGYAENYVYTPSIQKEREIIEKTGAQILRILGEESHNGSGSPVYGIWRYAGGGALVGKGVHPLGGALYLKRVEGLARNGKAIRPAKVVSRVHEITRLDSYEDKKLIRTDYHDIEDYGFIHVIFEDGTVADIMTSEIVLGGLYDFIEVFANNHRTKCNISPVSIVDTYNPVDEQYKDIYLVEKLSTKEGWSPCPYDENFTVGYQAQMQDFLTATAAKGKCQSDLDLALDTMAATYAAYVSDQKKGQEVEVPLL